VAYLERIAPDGSTKSYVFQELSIPMRHSRHLEVNCKEQAKRT
jgi:hypothetical protein